MNRSDRRRRDAQIVAEFAAGRSQLSLALQHGLTRRQIGNITRRAGIFVDRSERQHAGGGGYSLRLNAVDRRRYLYLRDQYGSDRAREIMGMARKTFPAGVLTNPECGPGLVSAKAPAGETASW